MKIEELIVSLTRTGLSDCRQVNELIVKIRHGPVCGIVSTGSVW